MPAFEHRTPAPLDLFVRWEPLKPGQATFHSGIDDASATIRVMGGGIWREADAHLYFDQQRRIVEEARRRFGQLRVFFDVRTWVVEGPQSALQFQDMNAELYRPGDRLAALVSSSSLKPHPRVALATGNRESFISGTAAETWLQAYAQRG